MLRKILAGSSVSGAFLGLAALNIGVLKYPQLWILFAIGVATHVLQPSYKPVDTTAPSQDRGTANQIVWSVYLTQFAGIVESVYFRYPWSFRWDGVTSAALLGMILGLALRTWSVHELGKFFSWHIMVQPDHRVVTTGPYCVVRHPGYSGALFLYVLTLVFLHAWISAALAPMVLMAAFLRRINYEENWLAQHLGDEYTGYRKQVKALIPFLW